MEEPLPKFSPSHHTASSHRRHRHGLRPTPFSRCRRPPCPPPTFAEPDFCFSRNFSLEVFEPTPNCSSLIRSSASRRCSSSLTPPLNQPCAIGGGAIVPMQL